MTDLDSDYFAEYRARSTERNNGPAPGYYPERPGGVTVVAVVLTLAILVNIVISFIALGSLSSDDYYSSQSTINAQQGALWANILLSLPVFVFVAGLFGEGDWARLGLISYLCCNSIFLLISFFAGPSLLQWIPLTCDIAIIVYLIRDEVVAAYPEESGKGLGVVSGIGLVAAQVIITVLLLRSAS